MKHVLITIVAVVLLGCGNSEANQALLDAAKFGNIKAAKEAIADGADVNAKEQRDPGWTPLHIATQIDHKEIAKLLIINDAYVNAKDNYGLTSLHWAARVGCKETAELLIEKGSDLNAKDDYGSTSLHNAAGTGHKEIAELLLANGADVNAKDNKDETPLNMAYISDQTEIADLLSKHGGKTGFQLQSSGN
jgi:ankyrin repeat protein